MREKRFKALVRVKAGGAGEKKNLRKKRMKLHPDNLTRERTSGIKGNS